MLIYSGALLYITNVLLFGLWYWELDRGGPAARMRKRDRDQPDFLFPQMTDERWAPKGWLPGARRLPVRVVDQRDGVQPHRHDAADADREGADGRAGTGVAGDDRAGGRAGREHPQLMRVRLRNGALPARGTALRIRAGENARRPRATPALPAPGHPGSAQAPPARLGADLLRVPGPPAGRHRRRPAAPAGLCARPRRGLVSLLPLPALRQLGPARAPREARPPPPARPRRDRRPQARQGAARPGGAPPDRGRPRVSLRGAGRAGDRRAPVRRPRGHPARRLLQHPRRPPAGRRRRARPGLRPRRDPPRPRPVVLAALRCAARGGRGAARIRAARGNRGGRPVVHEALGRVPDVHRHGRAAAAGDLRAARAGLGAEGDRLRDQHRRGRLPALRQAAVRAARRGPDRRGASRPGHELGDDRGGDATASGKAG